MRRFGLCTALALCVCGLPATQESVLDNGRLNPKAKAFLPYRSNGPYRLKMASDVATTCRLGQIVISIKPPWFDLRSRAAVDQWKGRARIFMSH